MTPIRAGDLRKRVAIEIYAPTGQDSAGEDIDHWSTVSTVWASIETPKAGRQIQLSQMVTTANLITHVVTMRFYAGLVPAKYRIRYGNVPISFLDLTVEDYAALTSDELYALTLNPIGKEPRYYTINDVVDEDERHYKTILYCTEATA
jgi:SPP1 family predicted phage head-tail adaptor